MRNPFRRSKKPQERNVPRVIGSGIIAAGKKDMLRVGEAMSALEKRMKDKGFRKEIEGELNGSWKQDKILEFAKAWDLHPRVAMQIAQNLLKKRR